jgi:hypothetical protein
VTVRATNDCGMDEMTFMPAVVEPPIVTLQPSDQAVRQGQSVTLAAVASGLGDVTYQWFMGEPGSGAPVSGVLPLPADGIASFGLGQVDFSDAGEYFVVVTSPCGQEVVSESASLGILFSAANSAQLVSHDFPTFMSPGETATVTIVLRNNSTVTWSDSQGYRLGVTADAGGFFGGTTRLPILGFNPPPVSEAGAGSLPPGDATMVVPVGGEAIFAATIAAPMTVGAFTIDIRMAEDPSAVFPALSLNPLLRATIAVGVDRVDFTSGGGDAAGWTGGAPTGFGGTTTVTAAGICLTAPGPGENLPLWVSPSNLAPLVANTVYKLRVTLSTDQTAVDSIPLLNFSYDNFQISNGFLNFGGERWIWDTGGGANGIGRAAGRTTYTFAFAPVSLALPQWNGQVSPESSAFTAEADQRNDLRLAFRVIDISVDVDGDGVIEPEDGDSDPLGALADSGTICIESIVLEIMPLADMLAAATPISSTPLNDGSNVPGMEDPASPDRTHFAQSSLNLTNFPTVQADIMDGHWRVRLPQIDAASDPNGAGFVRATLGPDVVAAGPLQINDPNGGGAGVPGLVQNPLRLFPVLWEQDAIYTVRAAIASDEAAETADPINLITLNFETYTAELGGVDFVTSGAFGQPGGMFLAGSPRRTQTTGGVTPSYMTFFHGNNATASLIQNANRWKAQVDVFNRSDLAGGPGSGLDGLRVESLRIDRIDMGGNN